MTSISYPANSADFCHLYAESWQKRLGFGTTVAWPAIPGALDATGNSGVVAKLQQTPYSIGYVGVSFHQDIAKAGLGTAALQSYDGEFLLPTPESIGTIVWRPDREWTDREKCHHLKISRQSDRKQLWGTDAMPVDDKLGLSTLAEEIRD